MKAVIVYKESKGYSLKTERECFWCKGMWFKSEEDIKLLYPDYEYYYKIVEFTSFSVVQDLCKQYFK